MILVTGADGYLGWPVLLKLSREFPNERIVGIDHGGRRKWVEEVGSVSAMPICSMVERIQAAHENGFDNISYVEADLSKQKNVYELLKVFKPRIIIHLAAQPSAPFSHISGNRANYTQENNNRMCRNFLWGMYELGLKECHFIETTTTGVYGAPEMNIPEGYLELDGWKGRKERIPYPGMATSWYHMSKVHDISNLYLAHHLWKLPITDLRTAIIFGASTEETSIDHRLATRFDFDFYFGVLPNRFVAQALIDYPITIYGKGSQRKPMIGLQDAVTSICNEVLKGPNGSFSIYNQLTCLVSPTDLATVLQKVGSECGMTVNVKHIPNPRTEKEEHPMVMENRNFRECLLPDISVTLEEGIREMINTLEPFKETFQHYKDRFI